MLKVMVLAAAAARAEEPPADPMEALHQIGQRRLIAASLGPPALTVGLFSLFNSLNSGSSGGGGLIGLAASGAGAVGIAVGPPMLASASIQGANLSGADPYLGGAVLPLWVGSLVSIGTAGMWSDDVAVPLSVLCYTGAMVSGGLQLRQNRLSATAASSLQLVPTRSGLALAGTF